MIDYRGTSTLKKEKEIGPLTSNIVGCNLIQETKSKITSYDHSKARLIVPVEVCSCWPSPGSLSIVWVDLRDYEVERALTLL